MYSMCVAERFGSLSFIFIEEKSIMNNNEITTDEITTNEFGVPYHSYTVFLANGDSFAVEVGDEDDWGNVQECSPDDCDDWETAVGWGNDADGHIKIVKVIDDFTGEELDVREWATQRVWSYVDCYSS